MRVLVACEFSGVVRRAFAAAGHDAWSCDLLPAEDGGPHIQGDALDAVASGWDLMIAHPPCTYLAVSGARWFAERKPQQRRALQFFWAMLQSPIPRIAVENPIGIVSTRIRKPDQIVQPWQFGHRETKATCLWLKGLPRLVPTDVVGPPRGPEEKRRFACIHRMPPGPNRGRERSRTYEGIALAMAEQWGQHPPEPAA